MRCRIAKLRQPARAHAIQSGRPEGWGVRPYDWQFGASIQQEILPRTSIEVGYSRRWFGNFFVYDNQLIGPNDFQPTTITAPNIASFRTAVVSRSTYNLLKPGAPTTVQDLYTFANDYGDYNVHWHGVDVTRQRATEERICIPGWNYRPDVA